MFERFRISYRIPYRFGIFCWLHYYWRIYAYVCTENSNSYEK